jgi:hypothetical protein
MPSISDRLPPVAVEYDAPCGRRCKYFEDAFEARRFYVAKDKAGKKPVVRNPSSEIPKQKS